MKAIKNKKPFSQDLLIYAWIHFESSSKDALRSELWKQMMMTYEAILKNTSDKSGWEWLKKYFINSLIWYLPHPNATKSDKKENKEDSLVFIDNL